jgi:hypothetical protein
MTVGSVDNDGGFGQISQKLVRAVLRASNPAPVWLSDPTPARR